MQEKTDFLFELYTEEIPAFYQMNLIKEWKIKLPQKLQESLIAFESMEVSGTSRRVYVIIKNIAVLQTVISEELKGPPRDLCFKDEKPTTALNGFAARAGVAVESVEFREIDNKSYACAISMRGGRKSIEVLPVIFEAMILEQKFPKSMRWADRSMSYARPIISYMALMGKNHVKFNGGIWETFLPKEITAPVLYEENVIIKVEEPSAYKNSLHAHKIVVNAEDRKELILKDLSRVAGQGGYSVIQNDHLVDEVNFLVESPAVVSGTFDAGFLTLPVSVILSEMEKHQRYFGVTDAEGKLSNHFLVVTNGDISQKESVDNIRKGNEKVLRARLSDGAYFFKEDKKCSLASRVEKLSAIIFHEGMGTMFDKKNRLNQIARTLIKLSKKDFSSYLSKVDQCADLLKADLTTLLVKEFEHLQGEIGSIYAADDGVDKEIAIAIFEHYLPRNQNDLFPQTPLGVLFSMADKIDNIFSGFALGKEPTSSQDPLALRRQTLYLIDILIKEKIHLSFHALTESIQTFYSAEKEMNSRISTEKIWDFISGRLATIFEKEGFDKKLVRAGIISGGDDIYNIFLKLTALKDFKSDPDFSAMMVAFKRMYNILNEFQKKEKGYTLPLAVTESLLVKSEERDFNARAGAFQSLTSSIDPALESYKNIFKFIAESKTVIDHFFDNVMVMDSNPAVRDNRLCIIEKMVLPMKKLLDIAYLQ